MTVDVTLAHADVCAYCGRGGTLVHDLDGDLVCREGVGCAAPPAVTRVAGLDVGLDALAAAPREVSGTLLARIDAELVLTGDEIDPEELTEAARIHTAQILRAAARRLANRTSYSITKLERVPSAAGLRRLAEVSVEARAAAERLVAWETRCNALRGTAIRAAQARARR